MLKPGKILVAKGPSLHSVLKDTCVAEDWYSVRTHGETAYVSIFGTIGVYKHWTLLVDQLRDAKVIELTIDCLGGDSLGAFNLCYYLSGRVRVVNIVGNCQSAAVTLALTGKKIRMISTGKIMVHKPNSFCYGPESTLLEAASMLKPIEQHQIRALVERSEQTVAEVKHWFSKDTYFTAKRALEIGLIDEVFDPPKIVPMVALPQIHKPEQPSVKIPEYTEDENFVLDVLSAFGRLKVHNRQNFVREVASWAFNNSDQ